MQTYREKDTDLSIIRSKKVAIIGYGSQGHAHAQNLRDSGVRDIVIGLRGGSTSADAAMKLQFKVMEPAAAAAWADVVMVLTPDENHGDLYRDQLAKNLKSNAAILFAHGLSIHFGLIEPRSDLDVIMVAPKGQGHSVRAEYKRGGGVPCLIAIAQDATGGAKALGLSYAAALGGARAGIMETSFREECETDLFSEQAILCGGLPELIKAGFETLVEAGYAPEIAYFECMHEVKLIVDLLYEGGLTNMVHSISNTAEYGAYASGARIVNKHTKKEMKRILDDIQSGRFVRDFMLENQAGHPFFKSMRRRMVEHPIERVGEKLRAMMPWIAKNRLVDRDAA